MGTAARPVTTNHVDGRKRSRGRNRSVRFLSEQAVHNLVRDLRQNSVCSCEKGASREYCNVKVLSYYSIWFLRFLGESNSDLAFDEVVSVQFSFSSWIHPRKQCAEVGELDCPAIAYTFRIAQASEHWYAGNIGIPNLQEIFNLNNSPDLTTLCISRFTSAAWLQ